MNIIKRIKEWFKQGERIMIDIKTLEKLFQLQFEEGEITITPLTQWKTEEKQNIIEIICSFYSGRLFSHKIVTPVYTLRLNWHISDKEHYNMCFMSDVLDNIDTINAMNEFVIQQSLKLKIARDRH